MRLFTTTMLLLTTATAKGLGVDSGGAEHGQQRCYVCGAAAGGACSEPASLLCPSDRPLCATTAVVGSTAAQQENTSVLSCATANARRPCSLAHYAGLYEMSCVCADRLCNAPFTKQLLEELQRFANANVLNGSDLIDLFLNNSCYSSTIRSEIYGVITDVITNDVMELDEGEYGNAGAKMPVAAALSDAAMVPSDDEEDDGEGSGLDEDRQGHGKGLLAPYASPRTTAEPSPARAASRLYRPSILVSHLLLLAITI